MVGANRGAPRIFSRGSIIFSIYSGQQGAKNQPYVSSQAYCRLPQSSHIAKSLKNRLQKCKSRKLTEETLKIVFFRSQERGRATPPPPPLNVGAPLDAKVLNVHCLLALISVCAVRRLPVPYIVILPLSLLLLGACHYFATYVFKCIHLFIYLFIYLFIRTTTSSMHTEAILVEVTMSMTP